MFTSLMIDSFPKTHSICLIYQAQRGFLLFLTVNLGQEESQEIQSNGALQNIKFQAPQLKVSGVRCQVSGKRNREAET